MTQVHCFSTAPPWSAPWRLAAAHLLAACLAGDARALDAALDRAAHTSDPRGGAGSDSGDEERRELLAGIVAEMRMAPRPAAGPIPGRELWGRLLAHLVNSPQAPPLPLM